MKKIILSFILTLFVILGCLCGCKSKGTSSTNVSSTGNSSTTSSTSDSSSDSNQNNSSDKNNDSTNTDSKDSTTNPSGNGNNTNGNGDSNNDDEPDVPDNSPTIYLETEKKDGKVILKVCTRNNPGVASFKFKVNYDKTAVSPEKIEKGLVNVTSNLQQTTNLAGYVTAVYVNVDGIKGDGTLFTITFSPKENIKSAEFSVSADKDAFVNADIKIVDFKLKGTKIEF